jgi:hypothetical protein
LLRDNRVSAEKAEREELNGKKARERLSVIGLRDGAEQVKSF